MSPRNWDNLVGDTSITSWGISPCDALWDAISDSTSGDSTRQNAFSGLLVEPISQESDPELILMAISP